MDKTKCISVYNGYRIKEDTQEVDLNKAIGILSTKKQRKYSYAIRNDEDMTATLHSHKVICPGCGKATPAYARYINKAIKKYKTVPSRVPGNIISSWGNLQMSFFDNEPEKLFLYDVAIDNEDYTCPHCGKKSSKGSFFADIIITTGDDFVKVSTIADCDSTMKLFENSNDLKPGNLPLLESLTFDFAEGVVWLSLTDSADNVFDMRGISTTPEKGFGTTVCGYINNNVAVKREIKRVFMHMHGTDCPFTNKELTVEKLVLMTWFIGYDRYFYDSLPYYCDTNEIAHDFKGIAKELHTKESARRFYEASSLPDVKSVRKYVFENPSLLFYVPELEELWKIFNDANLFCDLLMSASIYDLLCEMHIRPCLAKCISDYVSVKTKRRLIKRLSDAFIEAMQYFMNYSTLSETAKCYERNSWKQNDPFRLSKKVNIGFSKPMHVPVKEIKDCSIDGFNFFWLRNSRDYTHAAEQLNNCLGEWHCGDNPVVCVSYDDRFVAAIEICGREIQQVRGAFNSDVSEECGFSEAYEKWCRRYALSKRKRIFDLGD